MIQPRDPLQVGSAGDLMVVRVVVVVRIAVAGGGAQGERGHAGCTSVKSASKKRTGISIWCAQSISARIPALTRPM